MSLSRPSVAHKLPNSSLTPDERNKRLRRQVLDPDILRSLLPIRARAVAATSARPECREAERRFREASPSYAPAFDDTEAFGAHACPTTIDSLKWWVPLTTPDDPVLVERYMAHQNFPYRVIAQTREASIGGTMIDIGANIGRMAIPRVILGDVMRVYCAEPDPLNYACLVRNVRDNQLSGLALPDQLAIGAADGTLRLERAKSPGGHRVLGADARTKREVVEVRVLTLDSWVDRVGIDLDLVRFVKVDVQGAEVDVLRGAATVLARKHIAWQVEVDLERLSASGVSEFELYALMRAHFTHFVDLNKYLTGPRMQAIADLAPALAYLGDGVGRTDVLLLNLDPSLLPE